jgi:hypothetical protein
MIGHEIFPIEFRYISYISVDYGVYTGTLTLHTPGLRNKRWRIEGMPKEVLVRISDFISKIIRPQPGVEFDPGDISKVTPGIRINPSQPVYPYYPFPPGNPNYPPQYLPQPFSSPDDERITDYQAQFLTYVFQGRKRTKILCDEFFGPNTNELIKIIVDATKDCDDSQIQNLVVRLKWTRKSFIDVFDFIEQNQKRLDIKINEDEDDIQVKRKFKHFFVIYDDYMDIEDVKYCRYSKLFENA